MSNSHDNAFTHSHHLTKDGAVEFECSSDIEKWPWLRLPSSHPIVVQSINYWASVETGKTRGTFDPTKWSALTYTKWETGSAAAGLVNHGIADSPPSDSDARRPLFRLTFFDSAGELVCRMIGTGVVFQNRDFEAWRGESKEKTDLSHSISEFEFAPASSLGVASDIERYVAPIRGDASVSTDVLVTKENGLTPAHPYHGGSGDHVNAGHLADAGFQFAHLVTGAPIRCTGGEIKFRHYVEFGKPFSISQTALSENEISMELHQSETKCTDIALWFETY